MACDNVVICLLFRQLKCFKENIYINSVSEFQKSSEILCIALFDPDEETLWYLIVYKFLQSSYCYESIIINSFVP